MLYLVLLCLAEDARLTGNKVPFMASLLFAVHPVFSEPVNYIQARLVPFCALFSLSGVLFALLFMRARKTGGRVLSVAGMAASIVLGALSKEVGIFYGAAAIGLYLFIFWGGNERTRRTAFITIALAAMAIGAVIIARGCS